MNWTRIALSGAAATAFVLSFLFGVWAAAIWLAAQTSPVAASAILCAFFFAFGSALLLLSLLARRSAPAAGGSRDLAGFPKQQELQAVSRLCEERPIVGLGLALSLGILNGMEGRVTQPPCRD